MASYATVLEVAGWDHISNIVADSGSGGVHGVSSPRSTGCCLFKLFTVSDLSCNVKTLITINRISVTNLFNVILAHVWNPSALKTSSPVQWVVVCVLVYSVRDSCGAHAGRAER